MRGHPGKGKGAQRLGPFCAPLLYGRFQFAEFVSHCIAGEISLQGRRDRRLQGRPPDPLAGGQANPHRTPDGGIGVVAVGQWGKTVVIFNAG